MHDLEEDLVQAEVHKKISSHRSLLVKKENENGGKQNNGHCP